MTSWNCSFCVICLLLKINLAFDLGSWLCENDPCSCYEDNLNCISSTCSVFHGGCNQCKSGYFKYDYNYKCVQCQEVFGDECMFCQDFNGCGQCSQGFNRIEDPVTGLWYCQNAFVSPYVSISFAGTSDQSGEYDDNDEEETADETDNGDDEELDDVLLLEDDGRVYRYTYSDGFLDSVLASDNGNDDGDCTNCTEIDEEICVDTNVTDDDERRRRLLSHECGDLGAKYEIDSTGFSWSPAKHVGVLTFSTNGGLSNNRYCTATLISPRWILTSARCVHPGGTGSLNDFYQNWRFYPRVARSRPIGSVTSYYAVAKYTFWSWINNKNVDGAFGWLQLESGILNENLGYTSLAPSSYINWMRSDAYIFGRGRYIRALGYPQNDRYNLYYTRDYVYRMTSGRLHTDNTDLIAGTNGAPMYARRYSTYHIYGVHYTCNWYWGGRKVNTHARLTKGRRAEIIHIVF